MKKQQRTGQAPGGFTDTLVAGNSPSLMGLGRGVAELKLEKTESSMKSDSPA